MLWYTKPGTPYWKIHCDTFCYYLTLKCIIFKSSEEDLLWESVYLNTMNVKVLQQVHILKCINVKQRGNNHGNLNLNPKYFDVTFCTFAAMACSSCSAWTLCRETTYLNQFRMLTLLKTSASITYTNLVHWIIILNSNHIGTLMTNDTWRTTLLNWQVTGCS